MQGALDLPAPGEHAPAASPRSRSARADRTGDGGTAPYRLPKSPLAPDSHFVRDAPDLVSNPELEDALESTASPNLEPQRDQADRRSRVPRNPERPEPETISIEEVLGLYLPHEQEILLFERGIRWYANRHKLDPAWLLDVVLVHEFGHRLTHALPGPGRDSWPTERYVPTTVEVHEGWAQLITSWVARGLYRSATAHRGNEFSLTFEELNRCQSPAYHVFEEFENEDRGRVMRSLECLRQRSGPAQLDDWKREIGHWFAPATHP